MSSHIAFPEEWVKSKSQTKKRRKLVSGKLALRDNNDSDENMEEEKTQVSPTVTAAHVSGIDTDKGLSSACVLSGVVNDIMKSIHNTRAVPVFPAELDLDVILSTTSFSDILSNIFHKNMVDTSTRLISVSKIYEESYMREPYQDERACAAGTMCEGHFINPTLPFTCVEFVLPGEAVSEAPQLCVLCSRKTTQKLFYDILFTGADFKGCIQRYGNLCNTKGEYARECMLICPPHVPLHCMPLPIMSHQRNKYEVYLSNGVRTIRQIKVAYEDFCIPLTKEKSA